MKSVPSSNIHNSAFRFGSYDIVRFKPSGSHGAHALFTAQTAAGALLRILTVSATPAAGRKAVKAIVAASSVAVIDAEFARMRATVVEDLSASPSRLVAFGDTEALPQDVLSSVLYRTDGSDPVLPELIDDSSPFLQNQPVAPKRSAVRGPNRAMSFNFARMARALGLPRGQQQLPEDPAAALLAYDAIEKQYAARKADDDLEPSTRQMSFARAIAKATGVKMDFDMVTGTRSQFSAYISANRDAFDRLKEGKE